MKRRSLLLLASALLVTGCGQLPTPISVENRSGVPLQSGQISGTFFYQAIGDLAPGQTIATELGHGGDTGLAVTFVVNGRNVALAPQGYFTSNGLYVVKVVVTPDLGAKVDSKWRFDWTGDAV